MKKPLHLALIFLAHASVRVAVPDDLSELEDLLHRTWETAGRLWPKVLLPAEVFVRHLAQQLPKDGAGLPPAQVFQRMLLADLYLACACVHEVPAALETLDRHYLEKLPALLAHLKQPATMLDEVCQEVRIHLLLGTDGASPRLARYKGRGELLSWIYIIAKRRAVKMVSPARKALGENDREAIADIPELRPDPELRLIRERYCPQFQEEMREAFAALPSEQRYLLRLHFIDRLSTTEMGTLFRVNQSTISRRLQSARQAVYEETKRRLRERLGLSSHEFESLLVAIDSQLDLSLSEVLKEEEEQKEEEGEEED